MGHHYFCLGSLWVCMIIVLPAFTYAIFEGKPYPVVEFPNKMDPNSLYGKPCKKGFNSHYVTLIENQDSRSTKTADYVPCNPDDNDPEFDEIVIFNPDQILPRYLVYYSRQSSDSLTNRHILWVDGGDNTNLNS